VGDHPDVLKQPEEFLKLQGIDLVVEARYGDVAESIMEYQRQHGIQLVLLGAFSHSKIHQFFLGSITTTIFRNLNVPMIVAK
jgi:nucleotide-binding universal stress UspA family protein